MKRKIRETNEAGDHNRFVKFRVRKKADTKTLQFFTTQKEISYCRNNTTNHAAFFN